MWNNNVIYNRATFTRNTCILWRLLLLLILFLASSSGQRFDVCNSSNNRAITKDITGFRTINLDLKGATFVWQAARGSPNLTVTYTKDLELSLVEQENKTLLISVNDSTSGQAINAFYSAQVILSFSFVASLLILNLRQGVFLFCLFAFLMSVSTVKSADCASETTVHLTVPIEYLVRFCESGQCWPVLCQLSLVSEYSAVPSNLDTLFADRNCTIKEPTNWKNWTEFYLGPGSENDYYGDIDSDGLVNILEYYGSRVFDDAFIYPEKRLLVRRSTNGTSPVDPDTDGDLLQDVFETYNGMQANSPDDVHADYDFNSMSNLHEQIYHLGTSPVDPDTDGDLLQDGFETYNDMDANSPDDVRADYDSDSMSNLDEQIYHLDPFNPDSDGDGVFDGIESQKGGNPSNPADGGQPPPINQTANIRLTVGDPSGSNSERYILHVGHISFQSPDFGVVGSDEFTFTEGQYDVTIQHAGTNLPDGPDYDYDAFIQKVSGGATVTIEDEDGLLGSHNDDNPEGKKATLIVMDTCSSEEGCECQQKKTCAECTGHAGCHWCSNFKQCRSTSDYLNLPCSFNPLSDYFVDNSDDCPCRRCEFWNEVEKEDEARNHWRRNLNRDFPCPCHAEASWPRMVPIEEPIEEWDADRACSAYNLPWCSTYHKGAYGCMRSSEPSDQGAGQQCCYYENGSLIPPEDEDAAGTPDRAKKFLLHQRVDVKPFKLCCKECEIDGYCSKYHEVRRGDNSHC